jgi:transposase
LILTEGQRHDSIGFVTVYEAARDSGRVAGITADKAYDSNCIRDRLASDRVKTAIPSLATRKRKIPCSKKQYRLHHKVENFFRKLFDFRRVATRYEKLSQCFLAMVHLAAVVVLLRGIIR